eukprot:CAMPEP_0119038136 /NCGR_PEP_ID=MMETSP1177-20130426/6856_1 /TAXON_ID=2985 /ORGANISM="Ochromonas sp, Strain CCMP1899" /LENGTH=264 /DNA_ID=CAMNT_0007000295 /DNA_START=2627 /DNA_END=3421 /DNA_ORIENTATION=-
MRLILMRRGSQGNTTTILADNEEESRGLTDAELVAIGEALYSITVYKATNEGSASTIDKGDELPLMECSICLMDVKEGEACRVLPKCSHMFHSTCLESWFHISVCCPLCKRSIRDILNGGEGIVPQRPNRRGGRLSLEPGTVEVERPSRRRQTTPFSSGNEQDPDSLTVPTSPSQINPIRNSLFTWNAFYPTPIDYARNQSNHENLRNIQDSNNDQDELSNGTTTNRSEESHVILNIPSSSNEELELTDHRYDDSEENKNDYQP